MRKYLALPEPPKEYSLDSHDGGWWSVVVPEGTTNLITNPSSEFGDAEYQLHSPNILSRSRNSARRGSWGLHFDADVSHLAYVVYTQSVTAGTPYTFSADFRGLAGRTAFIDICDTGTFPLIPIARTEFEATGDWQRVFVTYTENTTVERYLRVGYKSAISGYTFDTDGWQLEEKLYPTTYCDGDQTGNRNLQWHYRWAGLPHQSISMRHPRSSSGGREVNLYDELRFHATSIIGASFGEYVQDVTELHNGRFVYMGSRPSSREVVINGVIFGKDFRQLQGRKRDLIRLISLDQTPGEQPILLRYTPPGYGFPVEMEVVYTTGLSGITDNHARETVPLTFRAYEDPYWRSISFDSHLLNQSDNWTHFAIAEMDSDGNWSSSIAVDINGDILASVIDANGDKVIAGTFLHIDGNSVDFIARWTGLEWASVGDGTNGTIRALANLYGANLGKLLVGGDFSADSTLGNSLPGIAIVDGESWSTPAGGVDGDVYTVFPMPNGDFYLGGNFSADLLATVTINKIAKYDIADDEFKALHFGAGLNGNVHALAYGGDGKIYLGGAFTETTTALPLARVAVYDPDTDLCAALDSGFNGTVNALVFGPDGILYAGGAFTRDGDDEKDLRYLAKWNGVTWEEISGLNAAVYALAFDGNDNLHVAGDFTQIGVNYGDWYYAIYKNVWLSTGIKLPTNAYGRSISIGNDDSVILGTVDIGASLISLVHAGITTDVINDGSARVYPKIIISGPCFLDGISNESTGANIYFTNNIRIGEGERAVLDLATVKFYSNVRKNLLPYVLPSSDFARWYLLPGLNKISALYYELFEETTTAIVEVMHHRQYHGFDEAVG